MWKEADWEGFREATEVGLVQLVQLVQLSSKAEAHISRKVTLKRNSPWWTRDIKEAVKARNRLGRIVAERREDWYAACRLVQELIVREKE